MLFRKRIRSQMYYGVTILFVIVLVLSISALQGGFKFRKLTKSIRERSRELPLTAKLSHQVSDLRVAFSQIDQPCDFSSHLDESVMGPLYWADQFGMRLGYVSSALEDYAYQLENNRPSDPRIGDISLELQSVAGLRKSLQELYQKTQRATWVNDRGVYEDVGIDLNKIQHDVSKLPEYLKQRMDSFAELARTEYHAWISLSVLMMLGAVVLLFFLMRRFHMRIFQPLDTLVNGSRRVAGGDFDHRIRLTTADEMSELAEALNAMTDNFQEINRDLNTQVQQRSREVVRSEQLASVGFLAAGVAHEINNPLASIAWSAESLESRLHDILNPQRAVPDGQRDDEIAEMKKYLQRIQEEAFRCKGITSSLLDFSRLGDARQSLTDMAELIDGVVEMLRPLSRYRDKQIVVETDRDVQALVNAQEIKQVVLNLVTNALDSIDPGGTVKIQLSKSQSEAQLVVSDDGCGMNSEVLQHIFEPFFTRRRDGQGTGLGLSITYRIIHEHGGSIRPHSDGPGRGSTFTVSLPLDNHDEKARHAA